jgi:hypothetical protein
VPFLLPFFLLFLLSLIVLPVLVLPVLELPVLELPVLVRPVLNFPSLCFKLSVNPSPKLNAFSKSVFYCLTALALSAPFVFTPCSGVMTSSSPSSLSSVLQLLSHPLDDCPSELMNT